MIGIEFTFNDGTKDWYDPINYPDDFEETENEYLLHMSYLYKIDKLKVVKIRHYNLCEICGRETYESGCYYCN